MSWKTLALSLHLLLCAAALSAVAVPAPGASPAEVDLWRSTSRTMQPAAALAVGDLERRFGAGLRVGLDPATGRVSHLLRPTAGPLAVPRPGSGPVAAMLGFLRDHAGLLPLGEAEIATLVERRRDRDEASGLVHLRFGRRIDGVRVFGAEVRAAVDGDGGIWFVGVSRIREGARPWGAHGWQASQAGAAALAALGLEPSATQIHEAEAGFHLTASELLGRPARLERVWYPAGDRLLAGWKARLAPRGSQDLWQVVVEDGTGRVLHRRNLTLYGDTRGRIFEQSPAAGARVLVPFPDGSAQVVLESPDGWADANESLGPNADVREDRDADDAGGQRATATGSGTFADPYLFDPPYTGDPIQDVEASVLNLFYYVNDAHDRFYELGFDEAAGNFQARNFGRGGEAGDPVIADAQDGSGFCNASFQPSPEGEPGRMTMLLWYDPASGCDPAAGGEVRDSALDADIVYHEYAHGVSTRLVGGRDDALCVFSLQSGALGEGWSDFLGASFTDDTVMGEYASFDETNGVRTQPIDAPRVRYTYGDLCTIAGGPLPCEPHADGEIWAQALWDARVSLQAVVGDEAGARLMERLVVAGMKLTPCSPTFLDARDAILAAERALTGGEHACTLWEAFARGGMGPAASTTGPNDQEPVEDTGLPAACQTGVELRLDRASYLCADEVVTSLRDQNLPGATQVVLSTAVDSETWTVGGPAPFFGTNALPFSLVPAGTAVADNGILEAEVEGDSITARYTDGNGIDHTATATVDCTARVRILSADILEETCPEDPAILEEFPELPRVLDADESVLLRVYLAGDTAGADLQNVTVQLQTTHPAITIEPAGVLDLGSLAGSPGEVPEQEVVLDFAVTAAGPLPSPDSADFSLNLMADGVLRAEGDGFTLSLNHDYERVVATLEEDMDPATGAPGWDHQPGSPPQDEWNLESCDGNTAAGAWHNGESGCGDYSDEQDNPWLASPPLPVGADTVAIRLDRIEYWHNIDLGFFPFEFDGQEVAIDVDAVVVQLENGPVEPVDPNDVFGLLTSALAAYANVPGFIASNTNGQWVREEILLVPEQSELLDVSLPVRLSWSFLPDVTDVFFECTFGICEAQGNGYYLDDLVVEYQYVDRVAQATACTPGEVEIGLNVDPEVLGPACPGEPMAFDASGTGAVNCPSGLDYAWTDAQGNPVLDDGGNPVTDPVLVVDPGPATTTEYFVTATCPDDGSMATRRVKGVVVCDADADASATVVPDPLCPGELLDLDAGASAFAQCSNEAMEFRWSGPGGLVADWSASPTAQDVVPAAAVADWTLEVRRQGDPSCWDTDGLRVEPLCDVVAEAAPIPELLCIGDTATLEPGAGAGLDTCTGPLEYRWSGGDVASPAWSDQPTLDVTVTADGSYTLEMRRADWIDCQATPPGVTSIDATDGVPSPEDTSLRVAKSGPAFEADVDLVLRNVAPSPHADYRLFESEDPTGLTLAAAAGLTPLATVAPDQVHTETANPTAPNRVVYFRAFGVNDCTGELVDP